MGAANPWGPHPWGFPSFVGTSPLGPLSWRTLRNPNFRAPSLGGPRALGAPRPGLVGLVGNQPLSPAKKSLIGTKPASCHQAGTYRMAGGRQAGDGPPAMGGRRAGDDDVL
jgi:hypothetical protein